MNSSTLLDVWEFSDTANRANVGGEYYLLGRRFACASQCPQSTPVPLRGCMTSPRVLLQRRVIPDSTGIERAFEVPGTMLDPATCSSVLHARGMLVCRRCMPQTFRLTRRFIRATKNHRGAGSATICPHTSQEMMTIEDNF